MVKMAFGEAAVPAAPAGGPVAAKAAAVKGLFDLHFKVRPVTHGAAGGRS